MCVCVCVCVCVCACADTLVELDNFCCCFVVSFFFHVCKVLQHAITL